MALSSYTGKKKKSHINNLNFHLKKGKRVKPKKAEERKNKDQTRNQWNRK